MVWFAFTHPVALIVILILLVVLTIWLLPKLWRGMRRVIAATRHMLGFAGKPAAR
jgi:hypothetical protein